MADLDVRSGGNALPARPLINRINRFLESPGYIMVVMLLTALSSIFSMELAVYTAFALIVFYVCVFGNDLLPLMPLLICGYVSPSGANNPGREEGSIFSGSSGVFIICLAAVIAVCLIYGVIRHRKRMFTGKRKLWLGMVLLMAAYFMGGIGSPAYPDSGVKHLFFALLQSAAIALPYFLFTGGVDWTRTRKDYFAWIGFGVGCLLLCQLIGLCFTKDVFVDGEIDRTQIVMGWGMHNNFGGVLAMMIPFPFYLAAKYRHGWVFSFAGTAFLAGVMLTCSRSSILTGGAIYLMSAVLLICYASNRKANVIALVVIESAILVTLIACWQPLSLLFKNVIDRGLNPTNRDRIYWEGLKLYGQYPVFGGSFFSPGYEPYNWSTQEGFSSFFPGRWHNTVVQMLASCGTVGILAYGFHRLQTIRLFIKNRSRETVFIGCSVLVLLLGSLLDCHFFNIGPTFFYGMALAFMENCGQTQSEK